ncbi:MAG TPA: hypothetical protein VNN77_02075 [candidate division Zixibacteria bacterium]|nr:hypothetical protein [candidate division Zixibacteria bacterium]
MHIKDAPRPWRYAAEGEPLPRLPNGGIHMMTPARTLIVNITSTIAETAINTPAATTKKSQTKEFTKNE